MDPENFEFRQHVVNIFNCDIFAVCETFLRGTETLNLTDYTWFGQNRTHNMSPNARRGSGGVGFFCQKYISYRL